MKNLLFIFTLLITSFFYAQEDLWDQLLQKHVTESGLVNYDGFDEDRAILNEYLDILAETKPDKTWSVNKIKAFWINVYNAYTISIILAHRPRNSITEINHKYQNAWEIPFVVVGGENYTLNHVEHVILRTHYFDPRIHFGVNCASISCPVLLNKAYTEENLEEMLNGSMKKFVNDASRNTIKKDTLELSQVFNWFVKDFTVDTDLITYINKYSETKIDKNPVITYKEYNWNLNKQPEQPEETEQPLKTEKPKK